MSVSDEDTQNTDNKASDAAYTGQQIVQGTKKRFGDFLIEKGLVSKDQIEIALREQEKDAKAGNKKLLGSLLVEMGFITESALAGVLAETTGVKSLDLKSTILDSKLINKVPQDVAIRSRTIPLLISGDQLSLAMADVYDIIALDQIRKYFPKNKIIPVYSSEKQILEVIDQYYHYEMSIDGILKEIETGITEKRTIDSSTGYVNPTVRLVDALLVDGIKNGASDMHFEPEESFVRIRYRIDGKLVQIRSFHKEYWSSVVVRIKILSGMNIAESRNPQDGRINYNVLGKIIDFRVATHPTIHGENIVMRILDKRNSLVPLSDLGFSESNSELLRKLLKRPEGIVIVTGPTGSGKTTTLYSMLNHINTIDQNIMTLEDPVEYQLALIRQSNIREGSGMDFLSGIKSLMRQDPDVIFVGEIRDSDSANMALRAAMTGHQVFSSLHTNDALGAIPRLMDIGVPKELLSGSLICIVAQRLASKLCTFCKEGHAPTDEERRILRIDKESSVILYAHKGCEKCGYSGYKGRIGISEVLAVDKNLDELIAKGSTRKVMIEYALSSGFRPMIEDGVAKVLSGITDLDSLIDSIDITDRL